MRKLDYIGENSIRNIKFTVAMSVYKNDNADFFDRALKSICINQTVKPNEILLVVDGIVSEEILKVIEKYEQISGILNVIKLPTNKGLGNALRLAVLNSSNNLIARMDSDDISVENRFEQQLKIFMAKDNVNIVGGDIAEFIDDEKNVVAVRAVPVLDCKIKKYLKKRCPMNHVTVMFKKKDVLRAGNYKDLFWNEDYFLWIRMVENKCVFENTGTLLVNVRVSNDMYKRRGGSKYFQSEKFLQNYMLKRNMISKQNYVYNMILRFIIQCVIPDKVRGFVFRTFARTRNINYQSR